MDQMAMVSLQADVPEPLLRSMRSFIEANPNWDQYRLFQAALAGFLVQNGLESREVTRCYLANLFPLKGGFGPSLVMGSAAGNGDDEGDSSSRPGGL